MALLNKSGVRNSWSRDLISLWLPWVGQVRYYMRDHCSYKIYYTAVLSFSVPKLLTCCKISGAIHGKTATACEGKWWALLDLSPSCGSIIDFLKPDRQTVPSAPIKIWLPFTALSVKKLHVCCDDYQISLIQTYSTHKNKNREWFVFAISAWPIHSWKNTWPEYSLPVNNAHFVKIIQPLKNLPQNSSNKNFTHSLWKTRLQHIGTGPWKHTKWIIINKF